MHFQLLTPLSSNKYVLYSFSSHTFKAVLFLQTRQEVATNLEFCDLCKLSHFFHRYSEDKFYTIIVDYGKN